MKYSYRFLINATTNDPPRRAALMLQLAWFNFNCLQASKKTVFARQGDLLQGDLSQGEAATDAAEAATGLHDVSRIRQTGDANGALLLKMSSQLEMLTRLVESQAAEVQSQGVRLQQLTTK